jgi:hypothetical protein
MVLYKMNNWIIVIISLLALLTGLGSTHFLYSNSYMIVVLGMINALAIGINIMYIMHKNKVM